MIPAHTIIVHDKYNAYQTHNSDVCTHTYLGIIIILLQSIIYNQQSCMMQSMSIVLARPIAQLLTMAGCVRDGLGENVGMWCMY